MAKKKSIIALKADPNDSEDFDVTEEAIERGLAERRARVGRPTGSDKEQVTLRLDKDVLAKFRAKGAGWQTRINAALKKAKA